MTSTKDEKKERKRKIDYVGRRQPEEWLDEELSNASNNS